MKKNDSPIELLFLFFQWNKINKNILLKKQRRNSFNHKLNKVIVLFFITLIFLFSGCSWVESFIITNETTSDITIEYEIEYPRNEFPIFDFDPHAYYLNSTNNIDWEKPLSIIDNDTTKLVVKFVLPPKSAIIIGKLYNDTYKKYNQYFINGRKFNLKKLNVINNLNIPEITPQNFDNYFKKNDNCITFRIK